MAQQDRLGPDQETDRMALVAYSTSLQQAECLCRISGKPMAHGHIYPFLDIRTVCMFLMPQCQFAGFFLRFGMLPGLGKDLHQ